VDTRTVALVLACLAAGGCVVTGGAGREPLPPATLAPGHFQDAGLTPVADCMAVAGEFRDSGSVLPARADARPSSLSATVFRRVLPADEGHPRRAHHVRLEVDPTSSTLRVITRGAGAGREDHFAYRCDGAWVHLVEDEGAQALADGAMQRHARTERWFARAADGGLLVQVSTRGRFAYYLSRDLPLDADGWFHFPAAAATPARPAGPGPEATP
jgi:hypothetical protein